MPIPPHFVGKQATVTAIVAAVVRTMRKQNGQTQNELGVLLQKPRGQINRHENNALYRRRGWQVEDLFKLDLAWGLPLGTVAENCAMAYERLRNTLLISDASSATRSLDVEQVRQVLEHAGLTRELVRHDT